MALPEKRRGTAWAVLDVPWRKMPKKALKHKKRRRRPPTIAAMQAAQAARAARAGGSAAGAPPPRAAPAPAPAPPRPAADMKMVQAKKATIVKERKVYAVGGDDENGTIMTSMVIWDATRRPPPPASAGGGAGAPWAGRPRTTPVPLRFISAAAAWLRGRLYLTGGNITADAGAGADDGHYTVTLVTEKQVLCWDPAAKPGAGWQPVAGLLTGRLGHAAVVLGGALYVLGGEDEDDILASVERYDPDQDTWVYVTPMTTVRNGVAAAVLDGRIIAVGGTREGPHDINTLRSCESYDPVADKWEALPDMATARCGPAVTVLGGRLWVTGGYRGGQHDLTTVEVFDPATNAWETKAPMTTGRSNHALAVLFGELHAIGGYLETSVEKYDAQADRWTPVPAMALPEVRKGTTWAVLDVAMPKMARAKQAAVVTYSSTGPHTTIFQVRPERASYAHRL
jgi:N-acetylneuraminic acid mutarotase